MNIEKLREYELTVVLVDKKTDTLNALNDKVTAYYFIKDREIDGPKTLAYPIRNEKGTSYDKGVYVYYKLLQRDDIETYFLTRLLDNESTVLRYMIVPVNNNKKGQ